MIANLEFVGRSKSIPTQTVRVDREVARQARMVAAALDVSLPEYLTETLRPIVEARLREIVGGIGAKRLKQPPAKTDQSK